MVRQKKTWIERNKDHIKNDIIKCYLRVPEVFSNESLNNFLDTQFELMCKDPYSVLRILSPFMVDYHNGGFVLDTFEEKLIKRFLIEQHHLTKAEANIAVDASYDMVNIRITIVNIIGDILCNTHLKGFKNRFKALLPKEIAIPFFKKATKSEYEDFYIERATLASYLLIKEFPFKPIEWLSFFESSKSEILNYASVDEIYFDDLIKLLKTYFTT